MAGIRLYACSEKALISLLKFACIFSSVNVMEFWVEVSVVIILIKQKIANSSGRLIPDEKVMPELNERYIDIFKYIGILKAK